MTAKSTKTNPTGKTKNKATTTKTGTLSLIIKDLKEYTETHPDIVETTKRYIDGELKEVKHIPVHKVIQVLDDVVVGKHGGSWSYTVRSLTFQIDCAICVLDLEITDKYGKSATRPGVGAADIYGRNRGVRTTDSVDNAVKMALASALKKASSQFELGISMWDKEDEIKQEPHIIKETPSVIRGSSIPTESRKEKPRKLPDELAKKIYDKQKEYNLTKDDVAGILMEMAKENGISNPSEWLLSGDQASNVEKLCKRIDEEMKKEK